MPSKKRVTAPTEISVITSNFGTMTRDGNARKVPLATLKSELKNLSAVLSEVLADTVSSVGAYELDEVTVKIEINAAGKIAVLGTGVSASTTGGVTLKFKRSVGKVI